MRLSPLHLTFLLELCLLGLASFLGPFCFGLFGDFIPKGENVRPKQACGLSLQVVSVGVLDRQPTKGSTRSR
jgi:hypothetical protein